MNNYATNFLAVLMLAGTGCAVVESPTKPNPNIASSDLITDEALLPYPIEYVYDRWSIIRSKQQGDNIVRPVEYYVTGDNVYDYSARPSKNQIFRAYNSDGKNFTYCRKECNINIFLEAVAESKTKATIQYFNYQGDPTPFAEEMRAGLKTFLDQ